MKKHKLIGLLAVCGFAFTAPLVHAGPVQHSSAEAKKALLAREALSQTIAPIKSRQDLERYLKIIPPKSNALHLLSPAARERFMATLTFNEKGLTGFGFEDLQRELSQEQIAKVLALFGSESSAKYIKPAPENRTRPGAGSNNCYQARDVYQPTTCPDPFEGGGVGGGAGGGFEGGGGYHPHPQPMPLPPPDPIPGQVAPVRLENGDIYHMQCESRATCGPGTNRLCKASC